MPSALLASRRLQMAYPNLAIRRALLASSSSTRARETAQLTSKLEVERKFRPSQFLSRQLAFAIECQNPRPYQIKLDNLTLRCHNVHLINDRYFDIDNRLALAGSWARRRSQTSVDLLSEWRSETTTWEVKQSLGGNYINSAMVEHEGRPKVFELWREHFSRTLDEDRDISFDLDTYRMIWTALDEGDTDLSPEHYHVILDFVTSPAASFNPHQRDPFSHTVGEVEKTCEVRGGYDTEEHDRLRQLVVKDMDDCIAAFLCRHPTMFQTTLPPVGKLSALAAWKKDIIAGTV
ncbi:hypothetical protein AMS68_001978 [Peltaster fructicola]|uniref:CYTH domain-containing protein n=1 Tax=Peltaster fructicola TaxID=286661 RepID=A0A6H0XP78_9PEZI|nr:hypothetical protein AMS68_001978 [Peltaster fructicola]